MADLAIAVVTPLADVNALQLSVFCRELIFGTDV